MPAIERSEITAGEAGRILGITRQAVHYRVKNGKLYSTGRTIEGVYLFSRLYIEKVRDDALRQQSGEAEESQAAT